jgi:aspartate/methionine/tyrosine aminotransferase
VVGSTLPALSPSVLEAHHSGIREISNVAITMPGVLRLDVGQPDFRTPDHIAAAGKAAIDAGQTFYTPTAGLIQLRRAISQKLGRVNGVEVTAEQVACASGGAGALAAALGAITQPGDEVLLPDPGWPNYTLMVGWTNTRAVFYPCRPQTGFQPDLEAIERLISRRTRVLVVNSPNNPTGAVYSPEIMRGLAELARRHNLWLVSDECYDQIMMDGSVAPTMLSQLDDGRVIACFTFSKTYSMTGWRLGYVVGSREVIDSSIKVLEGSSSCTSTITQKAAEAALSGPQDCVGVMVAAYRRRRDLAVDLLREAEMLISVPEGAFYIMADVSAAGIPSRELAMRLLQERQVGVAPGDAFGQVAAQSVRISLASADADLREGIGRLAEFVQELAAGRRSA